MTVFFFNDTATTEIYTLSLHDALPIYLKVQQRTKQTKLTTWILYFGRKRQIKMQHKKVKYRDRPGGADRKSTRLNSSHANISYAVFCLKKKQTESVHIPSPCHHRALPS